jgi:hypothetical protein
MAITHLGQDGYIRVMKEAVYGTAVMTSPTYLPVAEGALRFIQEQIEKQNMINNRVGQLPQKGRKKVGVDDITLQLAPDLMGLFLQLCFGVSTNSGSGAVTHTWLVPKTGESCGASWTVEQAIGSDTANQYAGVKCTKFVIKSDNEGIMTITLSLAGVGLENNAVARATTVTVSALDYLTFAHGKVEFTPDGVSQYTQLVNSFEIEVDFGYLDDGQRFKIGADTAQAPIFGTIPKTTFRCEIDAEKRYETYAQDIKEIDVNVTLTSNEICNGTTPYSLAFEAKNMILSPDTFRENGNDNLTQSLELTAKAGGATTGSDSAVVQGEFRVVDATATYPA